VRAAAAMIDDIHILWNQHRERRRVMATEKKDTTPRCANPDCKREIRFIMVEPERGKTLKIEAVHKKDHKGFFCPASVLARSTVSEKRKELAARCPYEAK
jgi:hypothetical protein